MLRARLEELERRRTANNIALEELLSYARAKRSSTSTSGSRLGGGGGGKKSSLSNSLSSLGPQNGALYGSNTQLSTSPSVLSLTSDTASVRSVSLSLGGDDQPQQLPTTSTVSAASSLDEGHLHYRNSHSSQHSAHQPLHRMDSNGSSGSNSSLGALAVESVTEPPATTTAPIPTTGGRKQAPPQPASTAAFSTLVFASAPPPAPQSSAPVVAAAPGPDSQQQPPAQAAQQQQQQEQQQPAALAKGGFFKSLIRSNSGQKLWGSSNSGALPPPVPDKDLPPIPSATAGGKTSADPPHNSSLLAPEASGDEEKVRPKLITKENGEINIFFHHRLHPWQDERPSTSKSEPRCAARSPTIPTLVAIEIVSAFLYFFF